MKKLIYIFIAAAISLAFVSCSDNEPDEPNTPPPTETKDPELAISSSSSYIVVDEEGTAARMTVGPDGGYGILKVEANFLWDAELESFDGTDRWLDVEYNKNEIQITVDSFIITAENDADAESRTAKVLVGTDEKTFAEITVFQSSQEVSYITVDTDEIYFSNRGESHRVYVETNETEWRYEIVEQTVNWLDVTLDIARGYVTFTADASFAEETLYSKIRLIAGDGDKMATTDITAYQYSGNLILEYTVTEEQKTIYLPLAGTFSVLVDFGDGSEKLRYARENVTTTSGLVNYTYDKAGVYEVSISGEAERLFYGSDKNEPAIKNTLTAVKQWGDLGVTFMEYAFTYCQALKSVPPMYGDGWADVTSFRYMFYYCSALEDVGEGLFRNARTATRFDAIFNMCTALESVPENIFENCDNASNFTYLFNGCAALEYVPEDLFAYLPKITQMPYIFQRSGIKEIPAGIFRNNPEITNFGKAFQETANLKSVPAELFANNPNVDYFDYVFHSSGLESVPAGLFDNNKVVRYFNYAFYNCENLTGESPYTVLDGVKYHLYEREKTEHFTTPTSVSQCFRNCTNLSDYDDIPSTWK